MASPSLANLPQPALPPLVEGQPAQDPQAAARPLDRPTPLAAVRRRRVRVTAQEPGPELARAVRLEPRGVTAAPTLDRSAPAAAQLWVRVTVQGLGPGPAQPVLPAPRGVTEQGPALDHQAEVRAAAPVLARPATELGPEDRILAVRQGPPVADRALRSSAAL